MTRHPGKVAKTLIAILFALAALAASAQVAEFPRSSPQSKEYSFTGRYHYVERAYAPAVVIPRVSSSPSLMQSAEEALTSQFSAVDALDYDWWLSTWDDAAQKKFAEREPKAADAKKQWQQQWEGKAGKLNVKLTRWMISGPYVILAYTLSTADQKGSSTLPETATAFRIWNGNWRATLDLEGDPVLLHFADAKTRFERVVRP
jgi:hypothetical protein